MVVILILKINSAHYWYLYMKRWINYTLFLKKTFPAIHTCIDVALFTFLHTFLFRASRFWFLWFLLFLFSCDKNHIIFGFWTYTCTKQCFKMSSVGRAAREGHNVTICLQTIIIIIIFRSKIIISWMIFFLKRNDWMKLLTYVSPFIFSVYDMGYMRTRKCLVFGCTCMAWMCEHVTITSRRTSLSQQIWSG